MITPPDPDGMNETRSAWAKIALLTFMEQTNQDDMNEALRDLLVDLRHLADRLPEESFICPRELLFERAGENYAEETFSEETAE